jgi:hypothetical protein
MPIGPTGDPSLKIAYLILCHKAPEQVIHLVKRLNDQGVIIVIHVDSRSNDMRAKLASALRSFPNVYFAKQYRCYWGRFGIVRATLSCIEEALKHQFDYAILLSGQDYPLKSNAEINNFFSRNSGSEFIESFALLKPNRWSAHGGAYQASYRALGFTLAFRSRFIHTPWMRKFPLTYEPHGGSQWWALSRGALQHIFEVVKTHPYYSIFFKFTFIPDETFFHSIISNSKYASRIDRHITYTDFGQPLPPYPKILDLTDLPILKKGEWIFGRKFDHVKSAKLVEKLDELAGARENSLNLATGTTAEYRSLPKQPRA